ncbi:MAG: hypothetical protein M1816_004642 [Peltula sp. TS41687]|nr:MAG: hypothetical protein M1816_004642 [Peltula sp. TS41687]
MRGATLLIAYGIWIIPISGLPLPQHNPFSVGSQQQPEHAKSGRYELQVHPQLQLPNPLPLEHEQQPQNVQRLQNGEQEPHGEQTQHQPEGEHRREIPEQEQTKPLPELEHRQDIPHQEQTKPLPVAEDRHQSTKQKQVDQSTEARQQVQRPEEASNQQRASNEQVVKQEEHPEQRNQGNRDLALNVALLGTGGTLAFSAIQNHRLHNKLNSANKQIQDLHGKHDRLTEELSKIDGAAAKRVNAPPPGAELIECILKAYDLPKNWKDLSFLVPAEIWNEEGPQCRGWRHEYRIAPGSYKNITPSGQTKPKPEQQAKKSNGKGNSSPRVPTMATVTSRMSNAVNRLGGFINKVANAAKPSPILGGFNLRPAMPAMPAMALY